MDQHWKQNWLGLVAGITSLTAGLACRGQESRNPCSPPVLLEITDEVVRRDVLHMGIGLEGETLRKERILHGGHEGNHLWGGAPCLEPGR